MSSFSNNVLIEARKREKLTQTQLASLAGINRASYSNIESGKRAPSVKLAKKIANVLKINWYDIYGGDN